MAVSATRSFPTASTATFRRWSCAIPNGLNGGTEVEPVAQIYAGDVLTSVSSLTSVELLPSRAYKRMVVRKTETVYTNQDGEVVARTRGTGISY